MMDKNIFFVKKGSYICGLLHLLNEEEFGNKIKFRYYRSDFEFISELEEFFDSSDAENNRIIIVRVTNDVDNELNEINDILYKKKRIQNKNLKNFAVSNEELGIFLFDEIDFYTTLDEYVSYEHEHHIVSFIEQVNENRPETIVQKKNALNMKLTCHNAEQDINTTQVYNTFKKLCGLDKKISQLGKLGDVINTIISSVGV